MKYMLVKWDEKELKWIILHYSHLWEDMYVAWKRFPGAELMINLSTVEDSATKIASLRIIRDVEAKLKSKTSTDGQ